MKDYKIADIKIKKGMIHLSAVLNLMNGLQGAVKEPFEIKFVKMSTGEIVEGTCVCTSSYDEKKTQNIKFINSGEIRKIRNVLIIGYNGESVYF